MIPVDFGVFGNRLPDQINRLRRAPGLVVDKTEHMQGVGMVRIRRQEFAVQGFRIRHSAGLMAGLRIGEQCVRTARCPPAIRPAGRPSAFRSVHPLPRASAAITPRRLGNGY